MKVLRILLFFAVVLSMAGCDTGSTDLIIGMPPPGPDGFYKEAFDKYQKLWEEQGFSYYSFDVVGSEYISPNNQFVGAPYGGEIPSYVSFCAHVTVEDGVVSIENIEPYKMTWLFSSRNDMDSYTWGAIPDIFDRLLSISMEEEPNPDDWTINYDKKYGFPNYVNIKYYNPNPPLPPYVVFLEIENFQVNVQKHLEKWAGQGVSDYSFDVAGYEYEPMTPFTYMNGNGGPLYTGVHPIPGSQMYTLDLLPPDAQFCAHVTVADGGVVSIKNIEPDERASMSVSGMSVSGMPFSGTVISGWSFSPDKGELGAYTWGAIPDIIDKIHLKSVEKESCPYGYDLDITYDKKYGFPNYLEIEIYTWEEREPPPPYHEMKSRVLLLHKVFLLYIRNFQVTENAPQ